MNMQQFSGYFRFRIDNSLSPDLRKQLESHLINYKDADKVELSGWKEPPRDRITVDFVSENSLHLLALGDHFKICLLDRNQGLFSFGQNIDESLVDAVLEDSFDLRQIETLISPLLNKKLNLIEHELTTLGLKNIKKFESKAKSFLAKALEDKESITTKDLLDYSHAMVELEKELIHSDDIEKITKVIKQFAKINIEKAKLQTYTNSDLWKIQPSKNILVLPKFKGSFFCLDMNWEDEDFFRLMKRFFFFHTIVSYFSSRQEVEDPFFDEDLWEAVVDSIPFPVALLTTTGEICQHNSLFSKLSFPPTDCLKLKLREKIVINDIPYNVFRKEVFHLDEAKILLVFFTESFFLKGDGNITPSGQELGIISSSIAHELNNPIAGIQAALTFLMLDENMGEEAKTTLVEMKNGAIRCKQLVETFLGFSRVNPLTSTASQNSMSPVDVCYQQALNLLRFRTVESGIRFTLVYSKHAEFRSSVNLSLLTMTFYLILGELMTLYSHQLLISDKNQIEKVIKGEIIESSQEIQIQLHELNISSLSLSKLIQNLLTIENFVLQVSDYSLRFIYNPPRQ